MERLEASLRWAKQFKPKNYVYFIRCHNFVKIGIGGNPTDRMAQLQIGCPYKLYLIHCYACENALEEERNLHAKYGSKWERGEWFAMSPSEIETMTTIRTNIVQKAKPKYPPTSYYGVRLNITPDTGL